MMTYLQVILKPESRIGKEQMNKQFVRTNEENISGRKKLRIKRKKQVIR